MVLGLSLDLAYRWHQAIVSPADDAIRGMALSDDGQVFATGYVRGSPTVAGIVTPGPGGGIRNSFVSAFSALDGRSYWTRVWNSESDGEGWGVVARANRLHACGWVEGPTDLGGGIRSAGAAGDGALATYRIR